MWFPHFHETSNHNLVHILGSECVNDYPRTKSPSNLATFRLRERVGEMKNVKLTCERAGVWCRDAEEEVEEDPSHLGMSGWISLFIFKIWQWQKGWKLSFFLFLVFHKKLSYGILMKSFPCVDIQSLMCELLDGLI